MKKERHIKQNRFFLLLGIFILTSFSFKSPPSFKMYLIDIRGDSFKVVPMDMGKLYDRLNFIDWGKTCFGKVKINAKIERANDGEGEKELYDLYVAEFTENKLEGVISKKIKSIHYQDEIDLKLNEDKALILSLKGSSTGMAYLFR